MPDILFFALFSVFLFITAVATLVTALEGCFNVKIGGIAWIIIIITGSIVFKYIQRYPEYEIHDKYDVIIHELNDGEIKKQCILLKTGGIVSLPVCYTNPEEYKAIITITSEKPWYGLYDEYKQNNTEIQYVKR